VKTPWYKGIDKRTKQEHNASMSHRFSDIFPLKQGRTHEVYGPCAYAFAGITIGLSRSPAFWFVEDWMPDMVHPVGLIPYCDPHLVLIGRCPTAMDVLAAVEEALRSGVVSFVVAEVTKPLTLKAGRRLQLAADAGKATGLMIIPNGMGSNATHTRWEVQPKFSDAHDALMQWSVVKNKSGTLASWDICWNEETHRLCVVSKAA
jgi:protein ImuA